MKTVILAGGAGTRLSEETVLRPKPMVEIGGKPMLWHIMSLYAHHGFKDFLVACGYKGEVIKKYFHDGPPDPAWRVDPVDTGEKTMTGGRLKRLRGFLDGKTFMATYGDGVGDIDVKALVAFHRAHGKLATVTAVHPPARFGSLQLQGDRVAQFSEKSSAKEGWINGGFFVFEPEVLDYIGGDETLLERDPFDRLTADRQLMAYRHEGFWQPMDTLREKHQLEALWAAGKAPWKVS